MTAVFPREAFPSLHLLQDRHAELVKAVGKGLNEPANRSVVKQFVFDCIETGRVIPTPNDRSAIQALTTFWVSRLERSNEASQERVEFDDVLLQEFDQAVFDELVIGPVEIWLSSLDRREKDVAKRLILRLVQLQENSEFETIRRGVGFLDGLDPRDVAETLLDDFLERGVIRKAHQPDGHVEYSIVGLSYLKNWSELTAWLASRQEFRIKATRASANASQNVVMKSSGPIVQFFSRLRARAVKAGAWMQTSVPFLARFSNVVAVPEPMEENEFEEAMSYMDKNSAELKYLYLLRQMTQQALEVSQERVFALSIVALFLSILGGIAVWQYRLANHARAITSRAVESMRLQSTFLQQEATEEQFVQNPTDVIGHGKLTLESLQQNGKVLHTAGNESTLAEKLRASVTSSIDNAELQHANIIDKVLARNATQAEEGTKDSHSLKENSSMKAAITTEGDTHKAAISNDGFVVVRGEMIPESKKLRIQFLHWKGNKWEAVVEELFDHFTNEKFSMDLFRHKASDIATVRFETEDQLILFECTHDGKIRELRNPLAQYPDASQLPPGSVPRLSPDGSLVGLVQELVTESGEVRSKIHIASLAEPHRNAPALAYPIEGRVRDMALTSIATSHDNSSPSVDRKLLTMVVEKTVAPDQDKQVQWLIQQVEIQGDHSGLVEKTPIEIECDETEYIALLAVCESNPELAFVSLGPNLGSWLMRNGKLESVLDKHNAMTQSAVSIAKFNESGDYLAIALANGRVLAWELNNGQSQVPPVAWTLKEFSSQSNETWTNWNWDHKELVFWLTFSPDGKYLATGSRDKNIHIYDLHEGRREIPPMVHSATVASVRFRDDGSLVASVGKSCDIITWQLPLDELQPAAITVQAEHVIAAQALSDDGQIVVAGGSVRGLNGWMRAWSTKDGKSLSKTIYHSEPVVQVSLMGDIIGTLGSQGTVQLYRTDGKRLVTQRWESAQSFAVWRNQTEARMAIVTTKLKDQKASPSEVKVFRILGLDTSDATFEEIKSFRVYPKLLTRVQFAPNGSRLVAFSPFGSVVTAEIDGATDDVLEVKRDRASKDSQAHTEVVTHCEFDPSSLKLLTASDDDTAIVWSLKEAVWQPNLLDVDIQLSRHTHDTKDPPIILKHTANINFAQFNPRGDSVVTCSGDGRAILWQGQADTYFPLIEIDSRSKNKGTSFCQFLDDRYLVVSWRDGTIRVCDTFHFDLRIEEAEPWFFRGRQVFSQRRSPGTTLVSKQDHSGGIVVASVETSRIVFTRIQTPMDRIANPSSDHEGILNKPPRVAAPSQSEDEIYRWHRNEFAQADLGKRSGLFAAQWHLERLNRRAESLSWELEIKKVIVKAKGKQGDTAKTSLKEAEAEIVALAKKIGESSPNYVDCLLAIGRLGDDFGIQDDDTKQKLRDTVTEIKKTNPDNWYARNLLIDQSIKEGNIAEASQELESLQNEVRSKNPDAPIPSKLRSIQKQISPMKK
jgi:WD40 repeat protein